ncbi:MAG: dihydrolipoyl dehydrogenase [Deltaproteobacteria bacterium]|nr:dihydrolipoyl dehydrogenase [Deltaproteobacteria bacterium]
MPEAYDIAFLGGGPAGYQGAIRAAQLGARVAVVEEGFLGGVCLNWGCIPTKTVRASAEVGRAMRRAKEFGFQPVEANPDIKAIIARKERVVSGLRRSIAELFQAQRIALVEGRGRFLAPTRIEVQKDGQSSLVEAAKVVIATGSRPARLSLFPQSPRVFLADEILTIDYLPKHLLVVGGGAVGVEMAAIFRELGSQVSLVEALDRLLPYDDAEMGEYLTGVLKRRKITVKCGVHVTEATAAGEQFTVRLADGTELSPDTILLAVGRHFNTEGLGLEELGVELANGSIVVDEHLMTNIPGLYAAGDVIGGWLLAHVAFAEGICAAEHALGLGTTMDYQVVPRCTFTLPEYAAVGVSEAEAEAKYPVKVARFPFKSLGMGQCLGELEGLVKIIAHAQTDKILGAHIIGPHAADMIHELALAMRGGLTSRVIMETIHAHPTLSESILEVAQALHGQAIHLPPPGGA